MTHVRRSVLARLAALTVAAGLAVFGCTTAERRSAGGRGVYSAQLHVHGPFSEGVGSIDSHAFEAADAGVDVIWWSEHDFRITSYEHMSRFGFEDWSEAIDRNEPWSVRFERHASSIKELLPANDVAGKAASFAREPVREGRRSLRLALRGSGPEFRPASLFVSTKRGLERRSLAARPEVRLAVYARSLGPDARAFVRFDLSEHAPRAGLDLQQYSLRYVLTNEEAEPRREGATFIVPLAYQPDTWNELVFYPGADAERGFPFAPGEDDCLHGIRVGVEVRNDALAEVFFDDLRIAHAVPPEEVFGRQREVIETVAPHHPSVIQHQGLEISYGSRHMNEFSLAPELLDYEALAAECPADPDEPRYLDRVAFRDLVIERAVTAAHARGGLISLNHVFGVGMERSTTGRDRDSVLRMVLRTRASGADLLEVGYRDRGGASLADHLWVWDRLAESGLRLVGVGVSDSHGGPEERWRGRPNNFVSWIHAAGPDQAALLDGLRAGRVFFGDIEHFDGTLDLVTARGWRMGQEVLSDRESARVEVRITGAHGLAGHAQVVLLVGREVVARHALVQADATFQETVQLPAGKDTFVRVELREEAAGAVVLGNPIYFLRTAPAEGLRPAAAALDVAEVVSRSVQAVRILGVEPTPTGLTLRVDGRDGTLVLETAAPGAIEVVCDGVTAQWNIAERVVTLRALAGVGTVELRRRDG